MQARVLLMVALLTAALTGLPLLGVWLDGQALAPYLRFPPDLTPRPAPPFSWLRFVSLALLVLAALAPFLWVIGRSVAKLTPAQPPLRRLPWWGWLGLALMLLSWWLAWTRYPWLQQWQAYTYTPIWLGYIVLINALCLRRTGYSLLSHRPWLLLALFPVSALFWWFFEYLNRFVVNWYYLSAQEPSAAAYLIAGSLPFSTVLPAVLSTRDWLASFPAVYAGLGDAWRPPSPAPRRLAALALAVAALGLVALPLWPDLLYPLLWLAPLVLAIALQALLGRPHLLTPLRRGDWRPIWLAALAALLCGLLWEMWNWHSLARWEYAVPYVHRFEIFEMPLLGYAGYLPFGLQCVAAATLFFGARWELMYGPARAYLRTPSITKCRSMASASGPRL